MGPKKLTGVHLHPGSGKKVEYLVEYRFTTIGANYQGYALLHGKKVRFALGVRTWGLWVLRASHHIQQEALEALDFSSMEKLEASANEGAD